MKAIYPLLFGFCCFLLACSGNNEPIEKKECAGREGDLLIIGELQKGAIHSFDLPVPSRADTQLNALVDYLGEAHLVGLGEATHGTAEFYRLKDKLFRQLVIQKGFKAIVFEIPWGNAQVVNDYVVRDLWTAESVLDQTWYWTYNTAEVLELIEWMHDYNLDKAPEDKIHFVGCDPQGGNFEAEKQIIWDYLMRVSPDTASSILKNYEKLPASDLFDYATESALIHESNIRGSREVREFLIKRGADFVAKTSYLEYQTTLMASHVIQQREKLYRIGNFGVPRDSLMAIYADWWQEILEADARIAIWAHNLHVLDGGVHNSRWMGTFLRQRHGIDYRKVAFSFGKGSFNAFLASATGGFRGPVRLQEVDEPPCGSVNHLLNRLEGDRHYLFFDGLTGVSRDYFEQPQSFLQLGSGFNESFISFYVRRFTLGQMADVLIHFDETEASSLR